MGDDAEYECPVCLEEGREYAMFPCRHTVCKQCTLQLWEVAQAKEDEESQLMCPLCRAVHKTPQGVDVFLQDAAARGGRIANDAATEGIGAVAYKCD